MVTGFEVLLLVEDGVDSDGGLASLPISDNEFSLSSANGHLNKIY